MKTIGYSDVTNIFHRIALIFAIKMFILFNICVYWWQADTVLRCRRYFEEKADQTNYVQMSVPESFLDAKIGESVPINNGVKIPDYVFYSLDEDQTNLIEEEQTTKESIP